MGSFTEVVLGFSFLPDTPDHVLAAFSALAGPEPVSMRPGTPAPPLPPPQEVPAERRAWEPSDAAYDPAEDAEPWRREWAWWFTQSMGVQIVPGARMVWSEVRLWHVSCRWGIKSGPESVVPWLQWLGPHLAEVHPERPTLLGYMQPDWTARPYLVWRTSSGVVELENLNEPWDMW